MKKVLTMIVVAIMGLSLIACKNESVDSGAEATATPSVINEVVDNKEIMDEVLEPTAEPTEVKTDEVDEKEVVVPEVTPEPEVTEAPVIEEVVEPEVTEAPVEEEEEVTPEPTVEPEEEVSEAQKIYNEISAKYGVDDWGNLDDPDDYWAACVECTWRTEKYEVAYSKSIGLTYLDAGYFGLGDPGASPELLPYYDYNLQENIDEIRANVASEGGIWEILLVAAKNGFETVEEYECFFRHVGDIYGVKATTYMQLKKEGVINWRENID